MPFNLSTCSLMFLFVCIYVCVYSTAKKTYFICCFNCFRKWLTKSTFNWCSLCFICSPSGERPVEGIKRGSTVIAVDQATCTVCGFMSKRNWLISLVWLWCWWWILFIWHKINDCIASIAHLMCHEDTFPLCRIWTCFLPPIEILRVKFRADHTAVVVSPLPYFI